MNPMITLKNISLLSLALLPLCPHSAAGQDLRQIGTNVYDLSAVARMADQSKYLVEGKVQRVSDGELIIRKTSFQYYFAPQGNPLSMGSADLLRYLAASKMSSQPLSLGHVLSLSPEMREHVSRVEQTSDVVLLHYPGFCRIGANFRALAMPVAGRDSTWDYGDLVDPSTTNLANVLRVHSDGIFSEKYEPPAMRRQHEMDASFARRLARAESGLAWEQFDVARDYLRGYGVETNLDSALYWFRKAAAQNFPEAIEFLRTNAPSHPSQQ